MSKIKPEVAALSEIISKTIKIDAKENKTTVTGDPYKDNLPEELSIETVEKVQDYNTTFTAATADAFGKASVEAMVKHKSLDQTEVEFSMAGKDKLSHIFDRKHSVHNPKTGETSEKIGVLTSKMVVAGAKNKTGQLGVVRKEIGELAVEKLAGK